MKKALKKILSLMLCVVFAVGLLPMTASAKTITQYSVGDTFEFGWYPQSEVTDTAITDQLNAQAPGWDDWTSYGYCIGTGTRDDGTMTAKNYMRYVDIALDGNKYRGVKFTEYRPYYIGYTSTAYNSNQDDNGYNTDTTYWFKFEPLQWRVLDPAFGLVLSETIIDSQAYNNYILKSGNYYGNAEKTYYANNYAESSIRAWLNDDFYNTAFSAAQQNIIETTALENKAFSTSCSQYDSASTNDKFFFLTYDDALNTSYGFSSSYSTTDLNRRTCGSDYAKCQGLYVTTSTDSKCLDAKGDKCSYWWLRSAGDYSNRACDVDVDGDIYKACGADRTDVGVRPAFKLRLTSEIIQSDVIQTGHIHTFKEETTPSTCTTEGHTTFTCEDCGYTYTKTIAKLSHSYTSVVTPSTCTTEGYTTHTCTACGTSYVDARTPATGKHTYTAVVTDPTCLERGFTTHTCSVCSDSYVDSYIPALGHTSAVLEAKAATCTETGLTSGTQCSTCKLILKAQETVPAKGHDYEEKVIAPTQTDKGYILHTCKNCGDSYKDTYTEPLPTVEIRNFVAEKKVDYRATVTFTASVKNPVDGAAIHWFVDGKDVGTGDSYTVKEAKKSYTLVAKYMQDGAVLAESEIETVTVKNGFFDKLKAFFRALFKKLPVLAQAFVGVETI